MLWEATGVQIQGTTALVTGATGGLGQAIARALQARGATLVLTGRRADVLEPFAADLGARAIVADVSDRGAAEALAAEAGDVDILVANAALPADGPLAEYTPEQIERALDVNLGVPIHLTHVMAPGMVARSRGHLVYVSSQSGLVATPGSSLYSATKFGLRGFAWGMREDLHGSGVGVTTVLPGPIADAGMFAETGAELPKVVRQRRPEDVGNAVVRGIERNRIEIQVSDIPMMVGSRLGGVAPGLVSALNRRVGAGDVAAAVSGSDAHRSKR